MKRGSMKRGHGSRIFGRMSRRNKTLFRTRKARRRAKRYRRASSVKEIH